MNTYHQFSRRTGGPSPLSPFLTIFHWPVTMATSIAHRVTGVGLTLGVIVLTLWLFAIESGPEYYALFCSYAATFVGQVVIWGMVWCYVFHFLNGIRHLFWDFGYGFELKTADVTGILVAVLSVVLTAVLFIVVVTGHGGYYATI